MYFCVLFIVFFVTFPVLLVCICVLNNCHRVATQLQLNISYLIIITLKLLASFQYYICGGVTDRLFVLTNILMVN